jgi:hypothetical protein
MSLLIVTGNITEREITTESTVEIRTHNYRRDRRVISDFIDIINSNASEFCMYGIIGKGHG